MECGCVGGRVVGFGWTGLDLVGLTWIGVVEGLTVEEEKGDFAVRDSVPYPSQGWFYPLTRKPCEFGSAYKSSSR
jgi:hypothetical protein